MGFKFKAFLYDALLFIFYFSKWLRVEGSLGLGKREPYLFVDALYDHG